jgi:hypothetical protein
MVSVANWRLYRAALPRDIQLDDVVQVLGLSVLRVRGIPTVCTRRTSIAFETSFVAERRREFAVGSRDFRGRHRDRGACADARVPAR